MSTAAKGKKDEPERNHVAALRKWRDTAVITAAWKVAYADFVTAMMALFLVLWLLSQADTKLKAAVANYFRSPGVFNSTDGGVLGGPKVVSEDPSADSASEQNMFDAIAERLKKNISANPELMAFKDRVKIEVTDEGLRIQIIDKADRVTFASGSAQLSAEAKLLLAEIAKAACQLPNPIAIGGHTDKNLFPAGSTYTNWELSADRANAARRALEASCVKAEQIRRVIGYADTELLYPNQPLAAANRRINITLLRLHAQPEAGGKEKPAVVEEKPATKQSKVVEEESSPKEASGKTSEEESKMEADANEVTAEKEPRKAKAPAPSKPAEASPVPANRARK